MPKLLKDKRIRVYAIDPETEQASELKGEIWAHYRSMSVKEAFNAGADHAWNNVYFTFTKPSFYFDTYHVIEYPANSKKFYSIEAIDLYEDKDGANIRVQARRPYGL